MKKRTSVRSLARAVRAEHNRRRQEARAKKRAVGRAMHLLKKAAKRKPLRKWKRLYNPFSKRFLRFPVDESLKERTERFQLEAYFAELSAKHRERRYNKLGFTAAGDKLTRIQQDAV
jgi:hypothetical protein